MPDLHDELDRLASRVPTAPSAEELRTHRERRDRRRARTALAVGLCVAVLGTALAYTALRPDDPTPVPLEPTWSVPDPLVVWPESAVSEETPAEAQARVDAGQDPWRLDPVKVIDRFARSVLGWSDAVVTPTDPGSYSLGRGGDDETELRVAVAQPVTSGDGGIWSLQSVAHPDLVVSVGEASAVFDLTIAEDRAAHVGVSAANDCRQESAFEVGLDAGRSELSFPAPEPDDPGCADVGAGYVFAYVMDDTTVPTGDPLLEAAAIEYPWLTLLPLALTMETASVNPASAGITIVCSDSVVAIEGTDVVAAQADGVHLVLDNRTDERMSIGFDAVRADASAEVPGPGWLGSRSTVDPWPPPSSCSRAICGCTIIRR